MTKSMVLCVAALALTLVPALGRAAESNGTDESKARGRSIVGSWTCESGNTPVGALGLLTTFMADNTFQIGTDQAIFGETHGVYRQIGVGVFQSFDKAFVFNAQGFADRVRVARAVETVLSATTMRINVDITITDRSGNSQAEFPAVFACDRMLVGSGNR